MPLLAVVITVVTLAAPPPVAAGRRAVGGQQVETNPNWGRSYSAAARFGPAYGRGPASSVATRPKSSDASRLGSAYGRTPVIAGVTRSKQPDLRTKFLINKFSANPWTFQITPAHDLWLQQPFPLR